MIDWKLCENTENVNVYEHVLTTEDPKYGTFMYSFGCDRELHEPEITGVVGKNKIVVYSNSFDMQHELGAKKIPSHTEFLKKLPLYSMGVADYITKEGKNHRMSFGIDPDASLARKEYVIRATFFPSEDNDAISSEEVNEILERISCNAEVYKQWIND